MATIRYFAYGSNMLAARLFTRCASARVVGIARAKGFELSFAKRSRDGSGKAMLAPSNRDGAAVHGVLFDLDTTDLGKLDRLEGVGSGYRRDNEFEVTTEPDGVELVAATYSADPDYVDAALRPYDWYLALVVAGARQHAFPVSYIELLTAVPAIPDPWPDRPARQAALSLLEGSGP
jgi:gamma-glutamylcyclotransferase